MSAPSSPSRKSTYLNNTCSSAGVLEIMTSISKIGFRSGSRGDYFCRTENRRAEDDPFELKKQLKSIQRFICSLCHQREHL